MSDSHLRRFTILDAMILIAATAIGIGLVRALMARVHQAFGGVPTPIIPSVVAHASAMRLAPFTFAWLIIRWRQPRRSWRRVGRLAGTCACLVASLLILGQVTFIAVTWFTGENPIALFDYFTVWMTYNSLDWIGGVIGALWISMALSRAWRAEPGWIDRSGRVIGAIWIIVALVGQFSVYFR